MALLINPRRLQYALVWEKSNLGLEACVSPNKNSMEQVVQTDFITISCPE